MANAASGVLAMELGLRGECYGTVSACAAGAHAIGAGYRLVRGGDVDACLVGGAESGLTPLASACFDGMGATSRAGISRPFDRRRDGFVLGEGAGVLLLEAEHVARRRGAPILGWLCGYGATADAHHLTSPPPSGEGSARAIRLALAQAGWHPVDVDYVNAHGTSTPLNDRCETKALKAALGARAATVPVSSTKSAIGHLLGAAGAVEAVATAQALAHGVAPPTLGYAEPDDGLDLDYVGDGPRPLRPGGRPPRAISNSFGFGGHNAVLCLEGPRPLPAP
jgi:3-oxoacyl-[acyl-carrier-protein] synthase II